MVISSDRLSALMSHLLQRVVHIYIIVVSCHSTKLKSALRKKKKPTKAHKTQSLNRSVAVKQTGTRHAKSLPKKEKFSPLKRSVTQLSPSITTKNSLVLRKYESVPTPPIPSDGLLNHNPPHSSPRARADPALTSSPGCSAFVSLEGLPSAPSLPLEDNPDVSFLCGSSASH